MMRRANVIVAVLIVGIAVAILLSAAYRVSGVADRVHCANRLRQMSLAVLAYHDEFEYYPRAAIPNYELSPEKRLSWHVAILPFMEETTLAEKVEKFNAWDAGGNLEIAKHQVKHYRCPADRSLTPEGQPAATNYVGIAGLGPDAASYPRSYSEAGFFGYDRIIRRGDITDGTSQVLMIIETSLDVGPWAAGGTSTVRGVIPDAHPYFGRAAHFGGLHRTELDFTNWLTHQGANAVLVDGTVRFLNASIDPKLIERASTIDLGIELHPDW